MPSAMSCLSRAGRGQGWLKDSSQGIPEPTGIAEVFGKRTQWTLNGKGKGWGGGLQLVNILC